MSADGRYIAYSISEPFEGVLTYDRVTGQTTTVSGVGHEAVAISGDGRFIAFAAIPGSPTVPEDLFDWDRTTGATTVVSVRLGGAQPDGDSGEPALSTDGARIAFGSADSHLVRGDTNKAPDVFVRGLPVH